MKDEIAIKQLGETIKKARKKAKWSQEYLATVAGIDEKTVWNIENFVGDPTYTVLCALIWALKLEPNEVIPFESKKA